MKYKLSILFIAFSLIITFLFLTINRDYFIQKISFEPFKAIDFKTAKLTSEETSLFKETENKPVVMMFWATWCPSCKEDIKFLEELTKQPQFMNFKVLFVSVDRDKKLAKTTLENLGFSSFNNVLIDETGMASSLYEVYKVPETFIIDLAGNVINHFIGPLETNRQEFFHTVKNLLGNIN